MAKKIEEYERQFKQAQAEKEKLSAEIEDLIRQESEMTAAANEAAASGDVDLYMKKAKEKERITATIYVKRMQLEKPAPYSASDVLASWKDYVERYNRDFTRKLEGYQKAAEALRGLFRDLIDLQNTALKDRERFCAFAEDAAALKRVPMATIDREAKKDIFIERQLNFPETADMRFCRVGCKSADEESELLSIFNLVINQQKPYNP